MARKTANRDQPSSDAGGKRSPTRWALAASGWVAALAMGILDTPAKINSFLAESPKAVTHLSNAVLLDKRITGTWGLEGIVDLGEVDSKYMGLPGAPVTISLTVYNSQVSGEIWSSGLYDHYVYPFVLVEGRRRGRVIEGIAYDYVFGKRTALARFNLIEGERAGSLRFKLIEQSAPYFPRESPLYKLSAATGDGLPERSMNPKFIEGMRRVAKTPDEKKVVEALAHAAETKAGVPAR